MVQTASNRTRIHIIHVLIQIETASDEPIRADRSGNLVITVADSEAVIVAKAKL